MADKKISELPLINTISGSIVYVPIVHDGITEKITVENFSKFTNKYAAQTGSANTFTANQTINANLLVTGDSTISSNATIGGNLVVNGKLTAQEIFTEITSASVIFESGSTIFGNSSDDTHQFTGIVSINGTTIGAQALNDFTASTNNQLQRVYQTTSSLNIQTGSQDLVNLRISSTTGSINTTTSSFDSVFLRIASTTGSINTTTSSFDSVFLRISSTTGSINTTTSSFNSVFLGISSVTGAMNTTTSSFDSVFLRISSTTGSINKQTGSQDLINYNLSVVTSSIDAHILGISVYTASAIITNTSIDAHILKQATQTGSQDLINYNVSVVTSSINAHILKQATQTGSQDLVNYNISVVTSSINAHILKQATQTGSQDLVNYQNSIITSSYRIELNSIEAYTSSLKNAISVSGTNVQIIGDLNVNKLNVQYISSSVLVTSGSNVFGDQSTDKHEFTGSVAVSGKLYVNDSAANFLIEGNGFGQTYLTAGGAIVLNPGYGGVAMVGSNRTFQATDITADGFVSGEIRATNNVVSSSTQIQNYDVFALNSNLYNSTGSIQSEINGLMALTASMKSQAIVSSSQQIKNYIAFVSNDATSSMTASYATMAGLAMSVYTPSGTANQFLYQAAGGGGSTTTSTSNITYDSTNTSLNVSNIGLASSGKIASSLDRTNNITLHDGSFGLIKITNGGTDRITLYRNTDTIQLSGSLLVNPNNPTTIHQITGSIKTTGSLKVGDWQHGEGVANNAKLDIRTASDRGLKINGASSSDVIITAYRGASDDMVRGMRLEGSAINIYIGDGNANTGSSVASFNTNGLAFENGKGIDFSATSNGSGTTTSEILNDYEVGTFTPTIVGGTTAGTATYSARSAQYTKVGNCVHFRADIIWTGHTGTGLMSITGLPFAIGSNYQTSIVARFDQTTSANTYIGGAYIYSSQIDMQVMPVGGGAPANLNITAAGDLRVSGFYFTT